MKFSTAYWKKTESFIEFIAATDVPDELPVPAVKLISVNDNRILLVSTPKGWDIPGGHVEGAEKPLETLAREIHEETGGQFHNPRLIGYLRITNTIENEYNHAYPTVSCILIYQGEVRNIVDNRKLLYEATATNYFSLGALPRNIADWSELSREIIDYVATNGQSRT